MATACTNQPSGPGGSSQWNQGMMVQGGPTSPTGYEGAGRPYYTTQVWKQDTGWHDYNGSERRSPWDAWQPQQQH
eukprot:6350164-Prorocentrum_lima.AAC.1